MPLCRLNNPQIERFRGMGVFYTALSFDTPSDATLMHDSGVVVGAGNSAGQASSTSESAKHRHPRGGGDSIETSMSTT